MAHTVDIARVEYVIRSQIWWDEQQVVAKLKLLLNHSKLTPGSLELGYVEAPASLDYLTMPEHQQFISITPARVEHPIKTHLFT